MKNNIAVLIAIIGFTLLGYILRGVVDPPKNTHHTDTVSVVQKIDSVEFAKNVLLKSAAKIEQYTLAPDGTWVKRKPIYKIIEGDTVVIDSTKYFNKSFGFFFT